MMDADASGISWRRVLPLKRPQRTAAAASLLLVLALQLARVARVDSATWDEAHHLYDGYRIWTRHDYRLNAEVPPLVKLAAAAPLLAMHLAVPPGHGRSQAADAFLDGRAFVFGNGGDRVLFPARMACTGFTLLLGWLVYAAGRRMFGVPAGLLALALFAFDPLVPAHGALVTTDVGCACCLFGAVFAFYRYTHAPGAVRLGVTGLVAGLAMAAKFTGLLIVPILVTLAVSEGRRARSLVVLGKRLAACAGICLCAWVVVWAFYGFHYKAAPDGLELSPRLGPYIQSMPNAHDAARLAALAHRKVLPEAYLWGLANTKKTEWEYTSYFFGRVYRHGPWQYFPAAFLIKSTLPLLLSLALLPSLRLREKGRELGFLLLPAGLYFAVVTSSHFDIGARHLMPVYPFLYVTAGAGAAAMFGRGRLWKAGALGLLLWQVAGSLRAAPAYMAYGNEAWGGPAQVHRYLSDANVDWGQQLKEIKTYLDRNHIANCWFAYFPDGAVEPADYGVHCRRLPTTNTLWWLKLPMEVPPVIEGTVLISDSDLEGIEFGDGSLNPYDSFRALTPTAVIMHGVDVYRGRFAVPLASALVAVRRSGELAEAGDAEAALSTARQAAGLAPGSAIVQLNLADRLTGRALWAEALEHYREAETAVQANRPDLQGEELLPKIAAGMAAAEGRH